MRDALLALLLALPALGLLNVAWFTVELRRFLAETPELDTDLALRRFERMAARQMYAALAQLVCVGGPAGLYVIGIVTGALHARDLPFLLVPAVVLLAAGLLLKPLERRVQQLPAATAELEEERDAVVDTWLHKALPDW